MYDNSFKLEEMLCFECHLDEYVTLNKNLFPDLTLRNSNNNLDLMNYYDIAKLNKDSLISTDEYLHLSNSTEINKRNYLINRSSYNHHLIMINLYYKDSNSENERSIQNFYFQSFDSGKTWEYLFNDTNTYFKGLNQIDHFDNNLWVSRRIVDDEKYGFGYSKIYRSTSPLTNIERQNRELGLRLLNDQNSLNIKSENQYINTQISLYDLEEKILFNKELSINKGNNYIEIPQLQHKLILVTIKTKNGDQVFKLLNTN